MLAPGLPFSAAEMVAELADAGYREAPAGNAVTRGDLPPHRRPRGGAGCAASPLRTARPAARLVMPPSAATAWRRSGWPASRRTSAALEPPLLASFYDNEVEERRPVTLDELPDPVVKTVLAAEDSGFFTHPGVSPTGIVRALWVNLRGGEVQQGGSTITQQLVKNVYLTQPPHPQPQGRGGA